jgi:hypothetical protein
MNRTGEGFMRRRDALMVNRSLLWLLAALFVACVGTALFLGTGVATAAPGAPGSESSSSGSAGSSGTGTGTSATGAADNTDKKSAPGASAAAASSTTGSVGATSPGRTTNSNWHDTGSASSTGASRTRQANIAAFTSPAPTNATPGTRLAPSVVAPEATAANTNQAGAPGATAAAPDAPDAKSSSLTRVASASVSSSTASALVAVNPPPPAPATPRPAVNPAPATPATVLDVFGSAFFTVYNTLIKVVEGPPVLPPGSTVSVASSTLQLPCGSPSCSVDADWYFPADINPQGLIYFQHGFLASGPMYSYTAATIAERTHSIVVAPSLTSNFFAPDALWLGGGPMQQAVANLFVGDRAALTASAEAAYGRPITLPEHVALVGHSLGGGFVLGTAGYMVDNGSINDLAGVVMLDGVAFDPALPETVFGKVPSDLPIYLISSEPYMWNMYGQMSTAIVSARPGQFNGFQLAGGRHIDYMEGGNPLIQLGEYLVAGFSQPQNIEAAKILEIGWLNDMFSGTHNGIYAAPSQAVAIPTNAGIAVATSLPAPAAPLSAGDALLQSLTSTVFNAFFHVVPASGLALL